MYDSDSDNGELMPKVFAVDDMEDDVDLTVPPTSGHEYLRRVMLEAKKCPMIVVADVNTNTNVGPSRTVPPVSAHMLAGLPRAPSGYAPTIDWQKQQVTDFVEMRQQMIRFKAVAKKNGTTKRLPFKEDANSWCKLCFGRLTVATPQTVVDESSTDSCESETDSSQPATPADSVTAGTRQSPPPDSTVSSRPLVSQGGTPPLLSIVAFMDQPTVVQVLEYHVKWFEKTGFTLHQGRWFYALLVCLEKPLEPECCSLLRDLARHSAACRAALSSISDERLAALNLLICLVSRYFDQSDLTDS